MIDISNNGIIIMTRGDSVRFPLVINCGSKIEPIQFLIKTHASAKVYFRIMQPTLPFERAIVIKEYDSNSGVDENGNLLITLNTEDTENINCGKYYYEVKMTNNNSNFTNNTELTTLIKRTEFYITE